jgi:pilus assembly protein CpaB
MRVSRIVLLLVALLAGGLAAWLATRGGGQPEQPGPTTQVVQEARSQVLITKEPVGVGQRLTADTLQWQDWPEGAVRPEYVTQTNNPDALTSMQGAVARFELFPGEPVLQSKLVKADQGYLSAVLDKGMRGVSISVAADSASGGFIVPNDHVDVVLTRGTPEGQTSETILSNVRILAINARLGETGKTGTGDEAGPDATDPKSQVFVSTAIATLELDPGQAETVINASTLGKLSLALRSIVDFVRSPDDQNGIQRNSPIRVIRYGKQANVTTGQGPSATGEDDTSVDPAAFRPPAITVAPVSPLVAAPQ